MMEKRKRKRKMNGKMKKILNNNNLKDNMVHMRIYC